MLRQMIGSVPSSAGEVAAGPAQHAQPQVTEQGQHVSPEAAGIRQRRPLAVHTPVDAAPDVLDEAAEHVAVQVAERPGQVNRDLRGAGAVVAHDAAGRGGGTGCGLLAGPGPRPE
jgi:hypothetical protein